MHRKVSEISDSDSYRAHFRRGIRLYHTHFPFNSVGSTLSKVKENARWIIRMSYNDYATPTCVHPPPVEGDCRQDSIQRGRLTGVYNVKEPTPGFKRNAILQEPERI